MDDVDGRLSTRQSRWLNISATWATFVCSCGLFVANVTWERPFVERVCEPRLEPFPDVCTTYRALTDSQWRSSAVWILTAMWGVAGAVAWRTWRHGQLARRGASAAFNERGPGGLLVTRRRTVCMVPGILAAFSFLVRKGTSDQIYETVEPMCSAVDGVESCRSGRVLVQQTVTLDSGMSAWPQAIVWMLVLLTFGWWIYVTAAENLARRFGEPSLWKAALAERKLEVPQYPAQQHRGKKY